MYLSANMLDSLVEWCNKRSPKGTEENAVIRYGLELIIENMIKTFILLLVGLMIHKFYETVVFLIVFSSIRQQIGGLHAKSQIGCTLCMVLIWGLSLIGSQYLATGDRVSIIIYFTAVLVIFRYAPKTKNVSLLSEKRKQQKKFLGIMLVSVYYLIAYFNLQMRYLIIYTILFEIVTLLPWDAREKGNVK